MKRIAPLAVLLTACAGTADTSAQSDAAAPQEAPAIENPQAVGLAPSDVTFAAELAVDLESMSLQESGLYIQVLEEGDGPAAAPGDGLGVDYTVWLSDGSKLDSSFDHQPPAPLPMVLGRTQLIDGWTEGVTGMRLGEKRRLVVPYQLAYGAAGRAGVPPYSNLVFEVELAEHTPAAAE
jgi:FKBP-type peptidyl-prolyl cis-trans isomerase FkpA